MKKNLLSVILFFTIPLAFATHQRAAEIIYKHINNLTYEVRIITYTRDNIANDQRDYLTIEWGDGNSEEIPRIIKDINGDMVYNEYLGTHTYSAPGTYILSMEDPNRNYGVVNIPNSINVPIYVETELVINPFLGYNSSVVLLNKPIDNGCVNKVFVHNPGAFDIDGDSLSYKLVECRGAEGLVIPGYTLPAASHFFTLNPRTGDVIWDSPISQGEFNIAFLIEEWRNGVRIGYVTRDMQIQIVTCSHDPPLIECISDTCVEAGSTLEFDVVAIDPDGNYVELTASGGPFEQSQSPAFISPDQNPAPDTADIIFTWNTVCNHVQKYPYTVTFKAEDTDTVNLVSFKTVNITVIGPSPKNLLAEALGNKIHLSWNKSECENASGYKIYRRNGYYGFIPGYCETGVPEYTGYVQIHELNNINDTLFVDDNNGNGLIHGIDYCYMVIATYPDGAESYASLEACDALKKDIPVITNVSNDSINFAVGNVFIAWSKPIDLDTIQYPGPYNYQVYRSDGFYGSNLNLIAYKPGLNDTLYFDDQVNLNTSGIPYSYRINLVSETIGDIGFTQIASSIFLSIYETDNELQLSWEMNAPWTNNYFVVYRRDPGQIKFDSIGWSNTNFYSDSGLINGQKYCYYIESIGKYTSPGFVEPIINYSQIKCGIPYDNVPPCPPVLSVTTICDLIENELTWYNPNNTCADDVAKYYIYYSPFEYGDLILIDSTNHPDVMVYIHSNLTSITACYAVTAIDSVGNESEFSNVVCVDYDDCPLYELPNIFTPNSDNYNDYFVPFPERVAAVEKIDLTIFNRWGRIVFKTDDPKINWDGKNQKNNKDCSQGVYFYVCDVYEITLEGLRKRIIRGSVSIYR